MTSTALFLCFMVIQLSSAGLLKNQSNLRSVSQAPVMIKSGEDYIFKPFRLLWSVYRWCVAPNLQEKKPMLVNCNPNDETQNWKLKAVPGGYLLVTLDEKFAFDNHGLRNHRDANFLETPDPSKASQLIRIVGVKPDGNFKRVAVNKIPRETAEPFMSSCMPCI